MNNGVFFSIIVPSHNEGRVISNTVNHLLLQQYRNFEIVVVDDGSKDDTSLRLINSFNFKRMDMVGFRNCLKYKMINSVWYTLFRWYWCLSNSEG